ncbi:hypothetical protein [Achromobacter sp. RTa]|uniref:hypothetical protein n=1 Tax=Achromobacter sp. RTa TaxID=1532557 RepID=UPI0012E03BCA|nr:hypothetical protein [Achromobacter sp. RTa]
MTQEQSLQDIIPQISMLGLALAQAQAHSNRDITMGYIGRAVLAAQQQGISSAYLEEVYQKTFPGSPLPIALSDEAYAELLKRQQSGNS